MITILTLAIGADYKKALKSCLASKEEYAKKHNYNYILGDETFWDRNRPIAWSKIGFILHACSTVPENSLIWLSDADVLITNPEKKVEEQIVPFLPEGKDLLMTLDACGNINSGNVLFRNTVWARDYWKRVGEQTQFTYHIWWENKAMIHLYETVPTDNAKIEITDKHHMFNAYLRGLDGQRLWTPGDFLVHFAGVYDLSKMEELSKKCLAGEIPRLSMYN